MCSDGDGDGLPAVLVEGHDKALVLDASNGGVVSVLACKHLITI